MGLVTLADKTQVNLTADNVNTIARRQLQIYKDRGIAVDEAATYQAFLEAAGRDTVFARAGSPGSVTVDFNALPAVAYQQKVDDNAFVRASNAVESTLPPGVAQVWTASSDAIFTAGDKAKSAALAAAKYLPGFLSGLNTTARIAIVGGGVIALAGAAVYLTFKFKR